MHLVDRVAHTNRWSGRHPADKLLLGGGLLLLSLILPSLPGAILVLFATLGMSALGAHIKVADFLRTLAVPAAFLASGALVLAFSLHLDGGFSVSISPAGLWMAMEVSLTALSATASLTLIVLTTPLTDLIGCLGRMRIPPALIDVVLLVYRLSILTFVVADSARASQASRLGYIDFRRSLRSTGLLAAGLLPRVLERAHRMQVGLMARAYDGELRTLPALVPSPSLRFGIGTVALQAAIAAVTLVCGPLADTLP